MFKMASVLSAGLTSSSTCAHVVQVHVLEQSSCCLGIWLFHHESVQVEGDARLFHRCPDSVILEYSDGVYLVSATLDFVTCLKCVLGFFN